MALASGGVMLPADLWDACKAEPVDVWDLDLDDAAAMRSHGAQVARDGGDKSECPVSPNHPQWTTWQGAWSRTRSRSEQTSGAMATRTALMKAEVRRQTEHLPYMRPDPCAEVLPECQHIHVNLSVTTSAFVTAVEEAARATAAAFTEAMDAVQAVFDSTGKDWTGLLTGIATDLPEPSIQQRRHGSAAHCPRHGQTRGGTCMMCARGRR